MAFPRPSPAGGSEHLNEGLINGSRGDITDSAVSAARLASEITQINLRKYGAKGEESARSIRFRLSLFSREHQRVRSLTDALDSETNPEISPDHLAASGRHFSRQQVGLPFHSREGDETPPRGIDVAQGTSALEVTGH